MAAYRFHLASPLVSRYIPSDKELEAKIGEYADLDIFSRLKKVVPETVVPRLYSLEAELLGIATQNKDKLIPRRVDGRHVGKTSVGEVFTGYAGRLKERTQQIEKVPLDFQNVDEATRNDRISDLVYFSTSAFSVEANIANDIRHLFRTEIGEVSHEAFGAERIGSSTMPHKRNPAEYEQVVSLWKEYLPRAITALLSQITEHQGDSTNEDSPYYTFELLCALSYVTKNLENSLKTLKINA